MVGRKLHQASWYLQDSARVFGVKRR